MISLSRVATQVRRLPQQRLFRAFAAAASNQSRIEEVLGRRLPHELLTVSDESGKHMEARDSHFNLYLVSSAFEGKSLLQR